MRRMLPHALLLVVLSGAATPCFSQTNPNLQTYFKDYIGLSDYDMALRKLTRVTESSSLEFRFETFNTFNHAQFDGAGSVDGNRDDATFGKILKSQPGRVSQVALKLSF